MNKKILYLTVAVVIVLLGTSAAMAEPPENPALGPLWSTITEIKNMIANLQGQINALTGRVSTLETAPELQFGDDVDLEPNTVYTAETDGFVVVTAYRGIGCSACNGLDPCPLADMCKAHVTGQVWECLPPIPIFLTLGDITLDDDEFGSMTFPVRKGVQYRVLIEGPLEGYWGYMDVSVFAHWIPLTDTPIFIPCPET